MASSKRRRISKDDDSDSSASGSEDESDNDSNPQELVNVDFEAYAANDDDFHGIKQLLLQLFLKAHVDLSQFTDLLIQQNHITSVIKNSVEPMEEDDEDSDSAGNFCFGVASVVNITRKREVECIKQLKEYLLAKCESVCSPEDYNYFKGILENKDKHVGLILNERLLNIPAQISAPIFEALRDDIETANLKQGEKKFNFANFLLISKIHSNTIDSNTMDEESTIMYVNSEEEDFSKEASFQFNFLVSNEKDTALEGGWKGDDIEWQPGRQVILLPADKWETIVTKLKCKFST